MGAQILVVEDDMSIASVVKDTLELTGYEVIDITSSEKDTMRAVRKKKPDLIIMDIFLEKNGIDGIEIARKIRRDFDIPIVYLTGFTYDTLIQRAKSTEPYGYIVKPVTMGELKAVCEMALYKSKTEKELKKYRDYLEELVEERTKTLNLYRLMVESAYDAIFFKDPKSRFVIANKKALETLGLPKEQVIGKTDDEIMIDKEEARNVMADDAAVFETRSPRESTARITGSDGRQFWFQAIKVPQFDDRGNFIGLVGVARDITQQRDDEEKIRASLKEKEILLKELHHRVKNNMQVISSLLNLQARQVEDPRLRKTLEDCRDRVRSMSLVHAKIYGSEDLSHIEFGTLLNSILTYLFRSYGREGISYSLTADEVHLGVDTAIPIAIIVNELIANALRHAFPDGRNGMISIALSTGGDGSISLRVSDNGISLPPGLDIRNTESLGLQLVVSLVSQISGSIDVDRAGGTTFELLLSACPP